MRRKRRPKGLRQPGTSSTFLRLRALGSFLNELGCFTITVSVTFLIPGPLRPFTGGLGHVEIELSPSTLRDALEGLWTLHPGIRDRVITEQGEIREHVNLFVGNEDVRYTGGLATPVPAGAEISIVPAISGGMMGEGVPKPGGWPYRR